jgi:Ca-activated chloride channel family protein
MISLSRVTFLAGLLFWLAIAPAQSVAQSADAILILDASGSMWGTVDGQTKISAARRAVDSILAKWKPNDRLGLMAYGHRVKGDCKDIELIVPPQGFDADRIQQSVRALNPKGKTPIADSLRAAARALQSSERKATVILVSDGIETCSPDPCAVAAELR